MRARSGLVGLGCAAAMVLAASAAPPAASAPADIGPRGSARGAPTGPPQGDADRDRVSDDFAPRLRAADAGARVGVIVTGLSAGDAGAAVGSFRITHRLPLVDGFSAVMTAGQARALARHPGVERVSADGTVRALDDAGNRDFGVDDARLERAGLDGSGIGVCVVDTGVDPGHEQLTGRLGGFFDAVNGRADAYDDHGHGTHVAGIALGDGTGAGASAPAGGGVAPAATLYAAKVLDASGYGSDSEVIAGVQWCAGRPGVHVISMSLGDTVPSDGTDPLSSAVDAAVAGGDVVVVAAGNSGDAPGSINAPGVAAGAVTVGAVSDHSAPAGTARHDDGIWLAAFSSRGPALRPNNGTAVKPDVVAPGVSVTAAQAGTTSGYVTMSGTSMATPFVAGAVALALEADPATTPADVKAALTQTAADRGPVGTDDDWGAGLVDVRALVDAVAPSGSAPVVAGADRTAYPAWGQATGTVANGGYVDLPLVVPAGGGGKPLAVTLTTTSGQAECYWGCLIQEWSPDLDLQLRQGSTIVASSECALSGLSCGIGRQETIGVPSVQGGATYTLRVYAFTGSPNNGRGGTFRVDLSNATVGTVEPPAPANQPPTVNAGSDLNLRADRRLRSATFTLSGTVADADGTVQAWSWALGGATIASGSGAGTTTLSQTKGPGTYTYVLRATDDDGASTSDSVVVRVRK